MPTIPNTVPQELLKNLASGVNVWAAFRHLWIVCNLYNSALLQQMIYPLKSNWKKQTIIVSNVSSFNNIFKGFVNQPTCYPNLRDTAIDRGRYEESTLTKQNSDTLCFFSFQCISSFHFEQDAHTPPPSTPWRTHRLFCSIEKMNNCIAHRQNQSVTSWQHSRWLILCEDLSLSNLLVSVQKGVYSN